MPNIFNFNEIIDPIKKKILNSPLGGLLSDDIGLMQYTDRNSGKTLTQAVILDQDKGFYWLVKDKTDSFWRNFQGGSPVVVKSRGNEYKGWAEITEEAEKINAIFTHIMTGERRALEFINEDMDQSDVSDDTQVKMFTKRYQILIVRSKAAL